MPTLRPLPSLACVLLLAGCGGDRETAEDVGAEPAPAVEEAAAAAAADAPRRRELQSVVEIEAQLEGLPPGTEAFQARWDNGLPKMEGFLCDGLPVGRTVYWHENGQVAAEGVYAYGGKPHGRWVRWYPNGKRQSEGSYHFGDEDGSWGYWYESGRPSLRGAYAAGKRHGRWTSWHVGGVRASEGGYLGGRKAGLWRYWDASGQELEPVLYHRPVAGAALVDDGVRGVVTGP